MTTYHWILFQCQANKVETLSFRSAHVQVPERSPNPLGRRTIMLLSALQVRLVSIIHGGGMEWPGNLYGNMLDHIRHESNGHRFRSPSSIPLSAATEKSSIARETFARDHVRYQQLVCLKIVTSLPCHSNTLLISISLWYSHYNLNYIEASSLSFSFSVQDWEQRALHLWLLLQLGGPRGWGEIWQVVHL